MINTHRIQMTSRTLLRGMFLSSALLFLSQEYGVQALQGAESMKSTNAPSVVQDENPLSFLGGMLVLDVQERIRVEYRENNFDFNDELDSPTDDEWLLQRFRLGATFRPVNWFKAQAQVQDSREFFSERGDVPGAFGAEGNDELDLRLASVEFSDYQKFPLGLKLGRQELSYGDERLIGTFDWNNIGRVFDAAKLRFQEDGIWIDGFAAHVVQSKTGTFNDGDSADLFTGIYSGNTFIPLQTTEFYVLYRDKEDNQPDLFPNLDTTQVGAGNGPAGTYTTVGARMKSLPGKLGPWDYETEFACQSGELFSVGRGEFLDLEAYALKLAGGYTFDCEWKPRIGLEYNHGSGDEDADDNTSESFQNLFPTNHKFYGYMDVFSWRNMHNFRSQFNINPSEKLGLQADYHAFWLDSSSDAWYRANAQTSVRDLNTSAKAADHFAGHEVDLTATYTLNKNIRFLIGYSHFFAGDYLEQTGASDDADFVYLQALIGY